MNIKSSLRLAGLSLFASTSLSMAEKVDFTLKFEPGQTYVNETQMEQKMALTLAGQPVETSSEMKLTTYQNVSEEGEGLRVEQGTSFLAMDISTGGMDMSYSSDEPGGPLSATMGPLLKAKTTVLLDAEGKITKVEAPAIPGMEAVGMGKEEMELAARTAFDLFPNQEVAVGEKWSSKTRMPMGGLTSEPVALLYEMTFEKMVEEEGRQLAQVTLTGKIESEDENLVLNSKKIEGMILFDPKLGQARKVEITMNLEMGLPAGIEAEEGAPGVMPIQTSTTSRLVEVKATGE